MASWRSGGTSGPGAVAAALRARVSMALMSVSGGYGSAWHLSLTCVIVCGECVDLEWD